MIKISASTNPCPENKLLDYAKLLQNSGVHYMHCDVMDGVFVPSKCLPYEKVRELSFGQLLSIDVHLMVASPLEAVKKFVQARPNYITVHYEAFTSLMQIIEAVSIIKKHNILAGISIKPNTPVENVLPLLKNFDLLMIMSVEPGSSGQKFLPQTIKKFEIANEYRKQENLNLKLQADGGVTEENVQQLVRAGVDIIAVGSALYNSRHKGEYVQKLQKLSEF